VGRVFAGIFTFGVSEAVRAVAVEAGGPLARVSDAICSGGVSEVARAIETGINRKKRSGRLSVVVYDSGDQLSPIWFVGSSVSNFNRAIPASSVDIFLTKFEKCFGEDCVVSELQFWCHGSDSNPSLGDDKIETSHFRRIQEYFDVDSYI